VRSLHKGVGLGHYELGAFVVMAKHAEDYRWSSANQQKRLDTIVETADTSVRATLGA